MNESLSGRLVNLNSLSLYDIRNIFTRAQLINTIIMSNFEIDIYPRYIALFYANLEIRQEDNRRILRTILKG